MIHLVLQASGELIDVGSRDVAAGPILKKGRAVTAYGVAAHLEEQRVHRVRVIFLRESGERFHAKRCPEKNARDKGARWS